MHQPIDFGLWNNWTYNEYILSEAWKARSAIAKEKAGYRCEVAGCNVTWGLQIHHLSYLHLGAELDSELICLCREHHKNLRIERR